MALACALGCVEPPRTGTRRFVVPKGRAAPEMTFAEPLAVDEGEDERLAGNGAPELTGPIEALRAGHAQAALARFVEVERDTLRPPFARQVAQLYIAKALFRLELVHAASQAFDELAAQPAHPLRLRVLPWVALLADATDTDAASETLRHFARAELAALGEQPRPLVERLAYLFGRQAMLAGEGDAALELLGSVSQGSPDRARALYLSGVVHVQAGRRDRALEVFAAAEEAGWSMPGGDAAEELRTSAQLARARVLYEMGAEDKARLDEALALYLALAQGAGNPDDARLELASTLYQLERYDEAHDALAGARAGIDERDPEAAVMGVAIELMRCRLDDAEARLARARKRYQAARDGAQALASAGVDAEVLRALPAPAARSGEGRATALALASQGGPVGRALARRGAIRAERKKARALPLDFADSATGKAALALVDRAEAHNTEVLRRHLDQALSQLVRSLDAQLERMRKLELELASARASCGR